MSSENTVPPVGRLQGVGGWLLVLCVYLMGLIPILAVLELLGAWQSANRSGTVQTALLFGALFEVALAGFAFYAGLMLYRRRPNAVAVAKVYFIAMLTLGILGLGFVLMGWVTNFSDQTLASQLRGPAVVAALRPIVLSVLWVLYLERSERVRATYPTA